MLSPQVVRSLLPAEVLALQKVYEKFKLPNKFKVVRAEVVCTICKTSVFQYIRLAQYSDGSWLQDSTLSKEEVSKLNLEEVEDFFVKEPYCVKCFNPDKTERSIAVEYYQDLIRRQHSYLENLLLKKDITKETMLQTIKSTAQRAAIAYGESDNWRSYLPRHLKGRF